MWMTQAAMCHHFRDQTYLQNTWNITKIITLFSIIIHHSHRCFHYYIYMSLPSFPIMFLIPWHLRIFSSIFITTSMETAEYWPMAWEYGIWNATIASLQFWAEDLNPVTLGIASECVYTHFFWTSTSHTLCQLSEEALFGHFVLTLNSASTQQLSLADEGHESGSNEDLPTPLHKTPCIHHVSSMEHASFNPAHTTPCHPADTPCYDTQQSPLWPVCCCLSFSSDQDHNASPVCMDTSDSSRDAAPEPSDGDEWMMNIGQQRWFQKEHSTYMRMGCPIMCARTHVLMELITLPRI